jgi:hypothetical protein
VVHRQDADAVGSRSIVDCVREPVQGSFADIPVGEAEAIRVCGNLGQNASDFVKELAT